MRHFNPARSCGFTITERMRDFNCLRTNSSLVFIGRSVTLSSKSKR
jgi:hypothetical protein